MNTTREILNLPSKDDPSSTPSKREDNTVDFVMLKKVLDIVNEDPTAEIGWAVGNKNFTFKVLAESMCIYCTPKTGPKRCRSGRIGLKATKKLALYFCFQK
jgi:hypothetical protein